MLNTSDRQRIIYLRYGSLTRFTRVKTTYYEISRKLHIPETTIFTFLKVFHARGNRMSEIGRKYEKFKNFKHI